MKVISVEHLSKIYRLGQIGTGTFTYDLQLWWARMREKSNSLVRIGEADHGNRDGKELLALKDVSFTVEQGEVLGIIGRNGAGKSTLLKILSRVTAPTSGKVKVKGRIASLLEVGTGFHPDLTGRENVYLNGAILGMSRREIDRKFDEIVNFAEVEKFIDTPVKRYSSGMYVRLAFAVAAHLEPEILVVDEVLAVGDAEFQKKCLGKMSDVAKQGRTVLFVSHNIGAVKTLCNRGILLKNGAILYNMEINSVVEQYFRLIGVLSHAQNSTSTSQEIFSNFVVNGGNDTISNNESLEISIDFKNRNRNSSGFSLFFILEDINGTKIVHDRKEFPNLGIDGFQDYYQIKIQIPSLWLQPGIYAVLFKLLFWGLKEEERFVSDKYPLNISGDVNPADTLLNPQADWRLT